MLDLLKFFVHGHVQRTERLKNLQRFLDDGFRASISNLKIRQGPIGCFVEGSIAKYLNGENATTLTRDQISEAFQKLETETGLDLHKSIVRVIEFGATIPVTNPATAYIGQWLIAPRTARITIETYKSKTVTLRNNLKSFTGYDKAAEMAPASLPESFEGHFALRMELRLKSRLKSIFERYLSCWDLLEPEIYNHLVRLWRDFYFQIPKSQNTIYLGDIETTKDIDRLIMRAGLQAIGFDPLYEALRQMVSSGKIDRSTAYRCRRRYQEIGDVMNSTSTDFLTQELDEKVKQIVSKAS